MLPRRGIDTRRLYLLLVIKRHYFQLRIILIKRTMDSGTLYHRKTELSLNRVAVSRFRLRVAIFAEIWVSMEVEKSTIRAILLYEFKKGTNAAQTCQNVCQTFGLNAVSHSTCKKWFQKFRSGDMNLEDGPRSGRSSEIDRDTLRQLVEQNLQLTTEELGEHRCALH